LQVIAPRAKHHFAVGVLPGRVQTDGGFENPLGTASGYTFPDLKGAVVSLDSSPTTLRQIIGSTTAHEIGHRFGFGDEYFGGLIDSDNPPPQDNTEGDSAGNFVHSSMGAFDVGEFISGRKRVFGSSSGSIYGFMGSSNEERAWTTQTEYAFLFDVLTDPSAGAAGASLMAQSDAEVTISAAVPRDVIRIAGSITKGGVVTFDAFFVTATEADIAPPDGTGYAMEFRDVDGNILAMVGFGLEFKEELFGDDPQVIDIDETPFSILTDLPAGTHSVSLLQDGVPLEAVSRSANAPEVSITGVVVTSGETVDVSWVGSDSDGDALTYTNGENF